MRSRKWSLFQTKRGGTPTGAVNVVWKNGDSNRFYVANTESIEQYLGRGGCYIFVLTTDVDRPSWIGRRTSHTGTGYCYDIFSLYLLFPVSRAGGNSKVMNFGKSRAKMSKDDQKQVTFKNVAGLDEEKRKSSGRLWIS